MSKLYLLPKEGLAIVENPNPRNVHLKRWYICSLTPGQERKLREQNVPVVEGSVEKPYAHYNTFK